MNGHCKTPLVSVIIPIYNVELYLEECLSSVCNQTLEDIEILCVDDYSTDRSVDIIEEFARKDSRIRKLTSKKKGVSFARNTGLEHARAECIQFIDSDDYIVPTMCETMYTAMMKHAVDFVVCGLEIIYEEGQEYRDKDAIASYFDSKTKYGLYMVDWEIMEYIFVSMCTMMIRKSLLEKYDIRFLERRICEDQYVSRAYIAISSTVFCLPDKLYIRRFRNGSIMDNIDRRVNGKHLDFLYQLEHLYTFFEKHNLLEKYAGYFWTYYVRALYYINSRLDKKYFKHFVRVADSFIIKHYTTIPDIPEMTYTKCQLLYYLGYPCDTLV